MCCHRRCVRAPKGSPVATATIPAIVAARSSRHRTDYSRPRLRHGGSDGFADTQWFFNIHHALKAHAMKTGFTTQVVWEHSERFKPSLRGMESFHRAFTKPEIIRGGCNRCLTTPVTSAFRFSRKVRASGRTCKRVWHRCSALAKASCSKARRRCSTKNVIANRT